MRPRRRRVRFSVRCAPRDTGMAMGSDDEDMGPVASYGTGDRVIGRTNGTVTGSVRGDRTHVIVIITPHGPTPPQLRPCALQASGTWRHSREDQ